MKHHKLEEFYDTEGTPGEGIENRPPEKCIANIMLLAHNLMEPLREAWSTECKEHGFGNPDWFIKTGYVGDLLNKKLEGKKSTPHMKGFAVDFTLANGHYGDFERFASIWLRDNDIPFDELIWYINEGYIHLSLKNVEGKQRCHMKIERKKEWK